MNKDIVIGFHGLRDDMNGYLLKKELEMMINSIKKENPNIEPITPFFSNITGHYISFIHIKRLEITKDDNFEYTKTR